MLYRRAWFSLTISVTLHGGAVGAGLWHMMRPIPPAISVSGGTGAAGAEADAGSLFFAPASPEAATDLPSSAEFVHDLPHPQDVTDEPVPEDLIDSVSLPQIEIAASGWAAAATDNLLTPANQASSGASAMFGISHAATALPQPYLPDQPRGPGAVAGSVQNDAGAGDGFATGPAPSPSSRNRTPRYPDEARKNGIEGTVILRVEVRENGTVGTIVVFQSSGAAVLDRAAIDAVATWHFEPSRVNGRSQPSTVALPIRFVLRK
jgi:protein TonB